MSTSIRGFTNQAMVQGLVKGMGERRFTNQDGDESSLLNVNIDVDGGSIPVTVRGEHAPFVEENVRVGDWVMFRGSLKQREWEGRTMYSINAGPPHNKMFFEKLKEAPKHSGVVVTLKGRIVDVVASDDSAEANVRIEVVALNPQTGEETAQVIDLLSRKSLTEELTQWAKETREVTVKARIEMQSVIDEYGEGTVTTKVIIDKCQLLGKDRKSDDAESV